MHICNTGTHTSRCTYLTSPGYHQSLPEMFSLSPCGKYGDSNIRFPASSLFPYPEGFLTCWPVQIGLGCTTVPPRGCSFWVRQRPWCWGHFPWHQTWFDCFLFTLQYLPFFTNIRIFHVAFLFVFKKNLFFKAFL